MLNQFLGKTFAVGVQGYYYNQVAGHSGSGARLGDFQGEKDILARLIGMLLKRNASEVRIQTVRAEPASTGSG